MHEAFARGSRRLVDFVHTFSPAGRQGSAWLRHSRYAAPDRASPRHDRPSRARPCGC